MEQREGRMLRQGNENPVVEILRYGVDRSFDANAYQRLDTKQRFIQSVMNGSNDQREAEDAGAEAITSFADAFAAISGNPLVRERFDVEIRIRHLERLQYQFEADQSRSREHLRRAKIEAQQAEEMAVAIRLQAAILQPDLSDLEQVTLVTPEGDAQGKESIFSLLEAMVARHRKEARDRLTRQLALDRKLNAVGDRRESISLPAIQMNGLQVHLESQISYRAAAKGVPERIYDPEVRYSFKIPDTDLWKSGYVSTGRGLAESLMRKIAELSDDAVQRDNLARTKRRQIVELSGLQDREFTHGVELVQQRQRLEQIKMELERPLATPESSSPGLNATAEEPKAILETSDHAKGENRTGTMARRHRRRATAPRTQR